MLGPNGSVPRTRYTEEQNSGEDVVPNPLYEGTSTRHHATNSNGAPRPSYVPTVDRPIEPSHVRTSGRQERVLSQCSELDQYYSVFKIIIVHFQNQPMTNLLFQALHPANVAYDSNIALNPSAGLQDFQYQSFFLIGKNVILIFPKMFCSLVLVSQ